MDRQELIQRFSDLVNSGQPAYDVLRTENHDTQLLNDLQAAYVAACSPTVFYQQPLRIFDERFEQVYELMRLTFDYDVLEDKEDYRSGFREERTDDHGGIVWGRFFRALGSHEYTPNGQLRRFYYDPLTVTEGVVGMILGSYIPMNDTDAIAGIGYLAVRPDFQRRSGHGTALLDAFEREALDHASRKGRRLRLILLESEDSAAPYWFKRGYYWPNGSRYSQPALHRDLDTGEALTPPAPKHLMIKYLDDPAATHIERTLLLDGLRTLFNAWYMPDTASEAASKLIYGEVFDDLFADFEQSLIVEDDRVALKPPKQGY